MGIKIDEYTTPNTWLIREEGPALEENKILLKLFSMAKELV